MVLGYTLWEWGNYFPLIICLGEGLKRSFFGGGVAWLSRRTEGWISRCQHAECKRGDCRKWVLERWNHWNTREPGEGGETPPPPQMSNKYWSLIYQDNVNAWISRVSIGLVNFLNVIEKELRNGSLLFPFGNRDWII